MNPAKVFIGLSSESLPATTQRTGYVAVTRGKEQVRIFTDDRAELLKAVSRPDEPLSAMQLADATKQSPSVKERLVKQLAFARRFGVFASRNDMAAEHSRQQTERGLDHDR